MQAVIKRDQIIRPINPAHQGNLDLAGFLFEEMIDHVEKLHEVSMDDDPDLERADYHKYKILSMIEKLKGTCFRGANFV